VISADTFLILLMPSVMLYPFNTKKLNYLYLPIALTILSLPISDLFSLHWFDSLNSHALVSTYSLVGLLFLTILMFALKWNFTQAFPTIVLLASASSYYWEMPYIVRNIWLIGFDFAWLSHVLFPVPFVALYFMIGSSSVKKSNKIFAILFGFLISIYCMLIYPIPPGMGWAEDWDSLFYLSNRVVCMLMMFYCFVSLDGKQKFRYREKL